MKYNIGDVVQFKTYIKMPVPYSNNVITARIGIIKDVFDTMGYTVEVCGIPNETYYFEINEIEKKYD